MLAAVECVQFYQLLMKSMNAKKCLELGTFTGYTSLSLAQALGDDGLVFTCDITRQYAAFDIWKKAGVDHKIKFMEGPGIDSLNGLLAQGHAETFDFVFIDADKENYRNYYELALKLIRKGGLIAIDNVLWSGHVMNPDIQDDETKAIRELNEFIKTDLRVDIILLVIGDGVTFCCKK